MNAVINFITNHYNEKGEQMIQLKQIALIGHK